MPPPPIHLCTAYIPLLRNKIRGPERDQLVCVIKGAGVEESRVGQPSPAQGVLRYGSRYSDHGCSDQGLDLDWKWIKLLQIEEPNLIIKQLLTSCIHQNVCLSIAERRRRYIG